MAATVQPVTATNGYVSEHSFDGIIVHLMSSSLLNEDYRFTQFSIANPFIFAKCFTLSVTRIKSATGCWTYEQIKILYGYTQRTKAILFLSVELDGVCKRYNVYQPNKSIYQIKVLFDTIPYLRRNRKTQILVSKRYFFISQFYFTIWSSWISDILYDRLSGTGIFPLPGKLRGPIIIYGLILA